jgi:hypothetical protein
MVADGPTFGNGAPEQLPNGFHLRKQEGDRMLTATCGVWTNPFGWELRLMSDGQRVHRSSIVRSAAEMRDMVETWRSAMLEKGWQASDCEPNRKIPSEPATTEDEIPTLDHAPNPPADHAHRPTGGES